MDNSINSLYMIKEIEQKFNVNSWVYNKTHLWPLIRFSLGCNINQNIFNLDDKNHLNEEIIHKHEKPMELKPCDILTFTHEHSKIKLDDDWYDNLMGPIIEDSIKLNLKILSMEYISTKNKSFKLSKDQSYHLLYDDISTLMNLKITAKMNIPEWEGFSDFLNFLDQNLPFINKPSISKTIIKYEKILHFSKKFITLLKQINPKLVLMVDYYNEFGSAMILACKELHIKTVDIQHGHIDNSHQSYGKWENYPSNGYTLLPDYFWVWNEHSKAVLEQSFKNNVLLGGNPFFNKIAKNIKKKKTTKTTILLTLQPPTYSDLKNILEIIKKRKLAYTWKIRVHPTMLNQIKKIEKEFLKEGLSIEIQRSSQESIFKILTEVDYHMTMYSSSCIEAYSFGIPTIFTHSCAKEFYNKLIKTNWAILLDDFDTIEAAIEHLNTTKKSNNNNKLIPIDMKKILKELI